MTPTGKQSPGTSDEDVLDSYRDRIFFGIAVTLLVLLTPFTVNHFMQGRIALGFITLTVVVIFAIDAEEDWDTVFKRCDEALYEAKEGGRNRVVGRGEMVPQTLVD